MNIGAAYYITPGGKNPPYFATAQAPVGQKKFSTSVADWAISGTVSTNGKHDPEHVHGADPVGSEVQL